MILDFHPDISEFHQEKFPRKDGKTYRFLGYWHSINSEYVPSHEFDRYEDLFGAVGLPMPWDYIDKEWDVAEREKVIAHLKAGSTYESWRGNSWCRFHGCTIKYLAGYRDLTDGAYVWPEGFPHYLEAHNIKPPQEFIDHVFSKVKQ